ncbi:MAG: hypothetical protein U1F83_09950 [Verrucomicrobiota bacterium]
MFTNDCTAIVIAGGWWENTAQVWADTNKTSLGNQWGRAPVLTEVVPFTITLPVATNYVQAWSLDERGQHKSFLPLTGNATSTTLTISTNAASIWYEITVARWTTSFDLWRLRYFNSTELANAAISGAAARPGPDGVPNLMKYYLGLPGRTNAPAASLPTGSLITVSNQLYLAMTYTQDKLVNDVDCVAEVSTDLVNWSSGPAYSRVASIVDLGGQERITIQDMSPVANTTHHFMRLRFQQH